jgi:glycosyltransferase involved in cell wall biosynthesis
MVTTSPAQIVGIVLPAYNEGKVIGQVLDELPRKLTIDGKTFEVRIIVVNDASDDSTVHEIIKRRNVTLINHILNSGAGAATRTGLHLAKDVGCNYVLTMDADGQHSASDVRKLINAIVKGNSDFIIGSRLKLQKGNMPTVKKVGNIGLGIITFVLLYPEDKKISQER